MEDESKKRHWGRSLIKIVRDGTLLTRLNDLQWVKIQGSRPMNALITPPPGLIYQPYLLTF